MRVDDGDDTINDHALLRPRNAAAWPAKARAGQDGMPAEHIHRQQSRSRHLTGLPGGQHRPQPTSTTAHTVREDTRARPCHELKAASHEPPWLKQRGQRKVYTPCKRGCLACVARGHKRTVRSSAVVHAMRTAAPREGSRSIADLGRTLMD